MNIHSDTTGESARKRCSGPAEKMLEERIDPTWTPTHAHNGYLETALHVGIPATLVLLLFLATVLYRSVLFMRNPSAGPERCLPFVMLCMLLVENFADSAILAPNDLHLPLLIAVAVMVTDPVTVARRDDLPATSVGLPSRGGAVPA